MTCRDIKEACYLVEMPTIEYATYTSSSDCEQQHEEVGVEYFKLLWDENMILHHWALSVALWQTRKQLPLMMVRR